MTARPKRKASTRKPCSTSPTSTRKRGRANRKLAGWFGAAFLATAATLEPCRERGRPSKAAPFSDAIIKWLSAEPNLTTRELLRRARKMGYPGQQSAFYALAADLRARVSSGK